METLEEHASRVRQLEQARELRRNPTQAGSVWPTPDDAGVGVMPIEIAPGRGDLNWSSGFFPTFPTALAMVGHRAVSFARLYMSQPWVAAAVFRMLTWATRVPLRVYRHTGDAANPQRLAGGDHPLAAALENPWLGGSAAELVQHLFGPILVHGNSVTEIQSGPRESISFLSRDWRYTRPIMPWRDVLDGFTFDVDNADLMRTVSKDEVLHIRWWSPTGPIGCSPLQQLGVTIQIEDAAQRFQRAFFAHGASPASALVTSEAFLGIEPTERQTIMKQLREDLTALYAGPENAGRPLLLPPGLDWKSAGQTTVEAALIDQRKVTREEIAAVYLINPVLLGILDHSLHTSLELMRDMVYTDTLGPPLVLIEQAISAQVCRDLLREPDVFVEFDFGAVLRGDRLQEINVLRGGVGSALMTPNEGRSVLSLPRSDNPAMDEFYLPTNNLQPVGSPPQKAPPDLAVPLDTSEPAEPSQPGDSVGRRLLFEENGRTYEKILTCSGP